ncbi:hypothetical protein D4R78_04180 [bacterium]|nr:MAG: hypothetical protein D4R78_04180 [bacterium]
MGCSSSLEPTYLQENITNAIQDIAKNEYKMEVKARLVGQTLWIYLPLEDIFVKSDKHEKYLEHFNIETNNESFKGKTLKLEYLIKAIPEQEKYQEYKYDKQALEKMNNVWKILRRVIFSMDHSKSNQPKFFCLVTADIKNGFAIRDLFYQLDLKKVSYEFISWGEYQHRSIQDSDMSASIIGDKEGNHLDYQDITMEDFISQQIQHRIKLKFQKPEVDKNADIDKEIIKAIVSTVRIYGFKDFDEVELNNLLTKNKISLNQAAIWGKPIE